MQQEIESKSYSTNNRRWHLSGWAFWSIAALFYAYEFIHRVAPSLITTQLREAFSVNAQGLGLIVAMYFYAYAAFQLPAGLMMDRYGAKRVLVMASAFLTIGSFLFTTTHSELFALVSRFLIGAGSAFAFVGCLKIGRQWLAIASFPLVVGLTNFCGTLGALSGGRPLSYLVQELGWREAFMQISFAGLFITLLIWFFLEDKKTISPSMAPQEQHSLFAGLILVMKHPRSWIIALYGAMLVAPIAALPELWGVEFLKISYQIGETQAASITHTIFVGTAVGGPLIGWLMIHVKDEIDFMMLATLGALILLSIFLYWINMPFMNLYIILFFYGVLTANMLLCFDLITKLHPEWAQGVAIGFINMVIMGIGGLTQHGVGWILHTSRAQHHGGFLIEDFHIALGVLPLCLLVAIMLTLFLKKNNERIK